MKRLRKRTLTPRSGGARSSGQATVEFAFAGTIFLMIIFGTIDFGRAIFIAADLHNAVREGSRYGSLHPTDNTGMKAKVVDMAAGTGLTAAGVTPSCAGGCTTGGTVTVTASIGFSAVTQSFLGLPAITLQSTSTREIE